MINLDGLRFIPQSNVKTGEPSLDKLVYATNRKRRDFDLRYEKTKKRFTIGGQFIGAAKDENGRPVYNQPDELGWTAAIYGSDREPKLLLLKTPAESPNPAIQAKFLKQPKANYFISDYLTLLVEKAFSKTEFWTSSEDMLYFRLEKTDVQGLDYDAFMVIEDPDV
ncbi:hypothetical protein GCM10028806_33400 [Spirosoma terrae]|uniref:Uncharacterized protein n=1 Tax=Spirosoma terrae TaxID=1968276 RepID=A0A6L9L4V9_9BACT|nr:hypothetical protein [Spirosoma terrae]NDU95655.1 hypothetical protein [Spirosoma terrae]